MIKIEPTLAVRTVFNQEKKIVKYIRRCPDILANKINYNFELNTPLRIFMKFILFPKYTWSLEWNKYLNNKRAVFKYNRHESKGKSRVHDMYLTKRCQKAGAQLNCQSQKYTHIHNALRTQSSSSLLLKYLLFMIKIWFYFCFDFIFQCI